MNTILAPYLRKIDHQLINYLACTCDKALSTTEVQMYLYAR